MRNDNWMDENVGIIMHEGAAWQYKNVQYWLIHTIIWINITCSMLSEGKADKEDYIIYNFPFICNSEKDKTNLYL